MNTAKVADMLFSEVTIFAKTHEEMYKKLLEFDEKFDSENYNDRALLHLWLETHEFGTRILFDKNIDKHTQLCMLTRLFKVRDKIEESIYYRMRP